MDKIIQKPELIVSSVHRIFLLFVFFFLAFLPRPTQNPEAIIYNKKLEDISKNARKVGKKKKKKKLLLEGWW
jgi:hypothetical protein